MNKIEIFWELGTKVASRSVSSNGLALPYKSLSF